MAEELHESEVIFSDDEHECREYCNYQEMGVFSSSNKKVKKKKQNQSSSVPVIIPSRVYQLSDSDDFEEDFAGEGLVPPHVIVERRIAGKMAFSVCTGNGKDVERERLERSQEFDS
ncbi:hypothetical protein OIU76_026379 [Salix suchowensis]|nr:hypothetical protein OIU76_026379 [Salix suchowensis]